MGSYYSHYTDEETDLGEALILENGFYIHSGKRPERTKDSTQVALVQVTPRLDAVVGTEAPRQHWPGSPGPF